ncbi:MAG: C25 family cysteine peptidase, partial [Anaerolineae bacterium]|nr:C25 family cysteine peptidase [Anaerolineae bacterium]
KLDPLQATKAGLLTALHDTQSPTLLFTASHGVEYEATDPHQRDLQGALLCQDWQGDRKSIPVEHLVAAQDINTKVNLSGSIAFLFACYSAGTPQFDSFYRMEFKTQGTAITKKPFVAALPQRMLRLQHRGALAVVGHVERVWGSSFLAMGNTSLSGDRAQHVKQSAVFESALDQLLMGYPIGSAMDYLNIRYAALSTELTNLYHEIGDAPSTLQAYELAELWTANNDARGYIILGDPAVRLGSQPLSIAQPSPNA